MPFKISQYELVLKLYLAKTDLFFLKLPQIKLLFISIKHAYYDG